MRRVQWDEEGMAEDEGEGGGGKVDMKKLAQKVDLTDVIKVLKVRLWQPPCEVKVSCLPERQAIHRIRSRPGAA